MALSVNDAWNSVALEERIELISKAQADGILAAIVSVLCLGAIGYGIDQIYFLWFGLLGSLVIMPLFCSRSWRKNKPALILSYLAARSVSRRYAYGFGVKELDIVLIFRGTMEEVYASQEAKELARQNEDISLQSSLKSQKDVWICLLRGGLVAISEKPGGAKLEFASLIDKDTKYTVAESEDTGASVITVEGIGRSRGRKINFSSNYPGALYVFHKQIGRLVAEATAFSQKLADIAAQKRLAA